jgi:hypothetical protein
VGLVILPVCLAVAGGSQIARQDHTLRRHIPVAYQYAVDGTRYQGKQVTPLNETASRVIPRQPYRLLICGHDLDGGVLQRTHDPVVVPTPPPAEPTKQ